MDMLSMMTRTGSIYMSADAGSMSIPWPPPPSTDLPPCPSPSTSTSTSDASVVTDHLLRKQGRPHGSRNGSSTRNYVQGGVNKCSYCSLTFTTTQSARRHELSHTGNNKPYECDICHGRFTQHYTMVIHKREIHEGGPKRVQKRRPTPRIAKYKCSQCPRTFTDTRGVKRHEISHSDNPQPFKCDICGVRFTQEGTMATHKRRMHEGQKTIKQNNSKIKDTIKDGHDCKYCSTKFESLSFLEAHMLQHHIEHVDQRKSTNLYRNFSCKICPMTFRRQYEQDEHKVYHAKWLEAKESGEPMLVYKIDENVQAKFHQLPGPVRGKYLKKFDPTIELPHCKFCQRACTSKHLYKLHMERCPKREIKSDSDGKYKCDYCPNKFKETSKLRDHLASVHMKLKRFASKYCSKVFHARRTAQEHDQAHERRGICRRQLSVEELIRQKICELCGESCHNAFYFVQHFIDKHRRTFSVPVTRLEIKPMEDSDPDVGSASSALCATCGNWFKSSEYKTHLKLNPKTCGDILEYPSQSCDDMELEVQINDDNETVEFKEDIWNTCDSAEVLEGERTTVAVEKMETRSLGSPTPALIADSQPRALFSNQFDSADHADTTSTPTFDASPQMGDTLERSENDSDSDSEHETRYEEEFQPEYEDLPVTSPPEAGGMEMEASSTANSEESPMKQCRLCNAPPMLKPELTQHIRDKHLCPSSVSLNKMQFKYVETYQFMSIVRASDDSFNIPWYICGKCGRAFVFLAEWDEHKDTCPRLYNFVHKSSIKNKDTLASLPQFTGTKYPGGWTDIWNKNIYPETKPHPASNPDILMIHGTAFCKICSKHFRSCSGIEGHVQRHKDEAQLAQDLKDQPSTKWWTELDDGGIQCTICQKKFKPIGQRVRAAKRSHFKLYHGTRETYPCKYCPAQLATSSLLEQHVRRHTGEEPLQCEICNQRFKSHTLKFLHKQDAHEKRTYQCDECGKISTKYGTHKAHVYYYHRRKIAQVDKSKDRRCPECGKEFVHYQRLRLHRQSAHGVSVPEPETRDQFVCDKCPQVFTTQKSLQRHQITVHPVNGVAPKFFQCKFCDRGYSLVASMKSHLRSVHKGELWPQELLTQNKVTLPVTEVPPPTAARVMHNPHSEEIEDAVPVPTASTSTTTYSLENYFIRNKWSKFL